MKILFLLVCTILSTQLMAAHFGFLTQDKNNKLCFVGIDEEDYEYSGAISNKILSKNQRKLMDLCQGLKMKNETAIIKIWKTYTKHTNKYGLIKYTPKMNVDCVEVQSRKDYSDVTEVWRYELEVNLFSECP